MQRTRHGIWAGLVGLTLSGCAYLGFQNLSLAGWQGDGAGSWQVISDAETGDSVRQSLNGDPGVFFPPGGEAMGRVTRVSVRADTGSDDDYIGFVLGYQQGEIDAAKSDFLLIDWKRADQDEPGLNQARAGLALSRVTRGLRKSSGAWAHDPADGVKELERAATLGDRGWEPGKTYLFEISYQPRQLVVTVDGVEELRLSGDFPAGALGFYNYSQENVTYAGLSEKRLWPVPPWIAALLLAGLGALLFLTGALLRSWYRDHQASRNA